MGTKIFPGDFDCYDNAEDDEPMFVLLARDPLAADLVVEWARRREQAAIDGSDPFGPDTARKTLEARSSAQAMREWRAIRSSDPHGPCSESGDSDAS